MLSFTLGMVPNQNGVSTIKITRRMAVALLAGTLLTVTFLPAHAGTTEIKVSLWDKGEASMDMLGTANPMGMAMPGADMSMASMGITADVTEFPAGEITFS